MSLKKQKILNDVGSGVLTSVLTALIISAIFYLINKNKKKIFGVNIKEINLAVSNANDLMIGLKKKFNIIDSKNTIETQREPYQSKM